MKSNRDAVVKERLTRLCWLSDLIPFHFHDPLQTDGEVCPVQVPIFLVAHLLETKQLRRSMHWPHTDTNIRHIHAGQLTKY